MARLVVDLSQQQLRADDGAGRMIDQAPVSTGLPASPAPTGLFQVASLYPLTSLTGRGYRIPKVRDVLCLGGGGLTSDAICQHPAPGRSRPGSASGCPAVTVACD